MPQPLSASVPLADLRATERSGPWSARGSFPRPQFNESAARSASLKVDTEGSHVVPVLDRALMTMSPSQNGNSIQRELSSSGEV